MNLFALDPPVGFGLMQRDASFDHYQDFAARYERRPSLWVEPRGNWGKGHLELIEIPSREDIHENIVAFWVPEQEEKKEGKDQDKDEPSDRAPHRIAYRLYWTGAGAALHDLGRVTATRMVRSPKNDKIRFIIDFDGPVLNAMPGDVGLSSVVETPEQYPVISKQLTKNPVTGGWRLDFTMRLPLQDSMVQGLLSGRDETPWPRLRALLKKGENLPDPLTETWIYDMAW